MPDDNVNPADCASLEELYEKVLMLPSSFPTYRSMYAGKTRAASSELTLLLVESFGWGECGDLEEAMRCLGEAQREMERSGDDNLVYKAQIQWCMADIRLAQGQGSAALEHYTKAAQHRVDMREYDISTEIIFQKIVEIAYSLGQANEMRESYEEQLARTVETRTAVDYDQTAEIIARKYLARDAEKNMRTMQAIEHRALLYDLEQGPLYVGAELIDEMGLGKSDSTLLGTLNL